MDQQLFSKKTTWSHNLPTWIKLFFAWGAKLKRNTSYFLICLQGKGLMHQESNWYLFLGNGLEKECQLATAVEFLTGTGILVIITRSLMSFQLEDFISWFPLNISLWAESYMWNLFATLAWPIFLVTCIPGRCSNTRLNFSLLSRAALSHSPLCLCISLILFVVPCLYCVCCGVCERVCVAPAAAQAGMLQC